MSKFSQLLLELVERKKLIDVEIKDIYKTKGFGFIDFLLGDLKRLLSYKNDHVVSLKHQINVVHGKIL